MCVTLGKAKLARTILYGAEVTHPATGKMVHVLGYQNQAENLADGPNAMILPIPAVSGSLSQTNLVSTEKCPHILEDMQKAIVDGANARRGSFGMGIGKDPKVEIFHHGIYTVVLSDDARAIPDTLAYVAESRRPRMNEAIFEAYSEWYPGWTIALCCFDNAEAMDATPMLWWYEPQNQSEIFLPTLDCHTGDVPNLNALVQMDHTIAIGSEMMHGDGLLAQKVTYSGCVPGSVRAFLTSEIMGVQWNDSRPIHKNGDVFINVNQLRQGRLDLARRNPLGVEGWGRSC